MAGVVINDVMAGDGATIPCMAEGRTQTVADKHSTRSSRLAVFGAYSDHDHYQRNRVLVAQLLALAPDAVVIRPQTLRDDHSFSAGTPLWHRVQRMASDLWSLWSQRHALDHCDTVFIPYPAYIELILLTIGGRLRGRRVIADAFIELHSTVVEDRQRYAPGSPVAALLRWLQRVTLRRADSVLIDTPRQVTLLREQVGGDGPQIIAVPVGIDETIWQPLRTTIVPGPLRVLFWGTFIPLHGVDVILAAARAVTNRRLAIEFQLVGDGQTGEAVAAELHIQDPCNVQWRRERVSSAELVRMAEQADVILGVFGTSAKAASVIPYKVQQGLALNLPVVTRETVDLQSDRDAGLITVPPGDPDALADALEALLQRRAEGWSATTRAIYDQHFSNAVIQARLAQVLAE